MSTNKQANKLIHEKSPYLLQHARNPVDWFPWGDEAFVHAVSEDKPIFLSIGYSTCHWCHVMAHESFEDPEVAEILSKHFISIKVDREERPDIDHIYMSVCQALTGQGGWPLTIFMTADKRPFYAGTYFPREDRMGIPGIITILEKISDVWKSDRSSILESCEHINDAIKQSQNPNGKEINTEEIVHRAFSDFNRDFDHRYGGFGGAPKFPSPHILYFLLRYWYVYKQDAALQMVEKTLDSMYKGGIYDHIGFGFSRYSTDRKWLVPHFEKMLYDNALLAIAYLEAFQATRHERHSVVAEQILTYVLRDMTSPEGGFYSAEDADSEGEEGKFYVWSVEEIKQVLGNESGEKYCGFYNISEQGNFEGLNIPNLIEKAIPSAEMEFIDTCRQKLFSHREKRIHPYKDDKILTAWNGLMMATMAIGGRVLGSKRYQEAAEAAAKFIFEKLIRHDGRLLARYRDGDSAYPGYVDDYAFLIWGLTELYETTYNPEYLQKAINLTDDLIKLFWDEDKCGLFMYGSDSEALLTRPKEIYDGAMPSGNSVAAMCFLRLARLTGKSELEEKAQKQFRAFGESLEQVPRGYSFMLSSMLFSANKGKEIVLVGGKNHSEDDEMLKLIREGFRPFISPVYYSDIYSSLKAVMPFIENYESIDGKTTAYVCENFSCKSPTNDIEQLKGLLQ